MKMTNIIKIAALAGVLLLGSCDQDATRTVYKGSGNVGFVGLSSKTDEVDSSDNGKYEVTLYRGDVNGPLTVPISLTLDEISTGLFSLENTTVTFADGENSVVIPILFTFDQLDPEKVYNLKVTMTDETLLSPSMLASYSLKLNVKISWQFFKSGVFSSSIFGDSWEQDLYKAEGLNVYRFPDLYFLRYPIDFSVNSETDKSLKNFADQDTGYMHPDYGMAYLRMVTPPNFTFDDEKITFEVAFRVSVGTFGDYVETFTFN